MWRRWKAGESLHEIGRAFGKGHGSIRFLLTERGGIVRAARRRSPRTLTPAEREDISRGIASGSSIREIAKGLQRAESTVSGEVARHGGRQLYRASEADSQAWESALRPKTCRLATHVKLRTIVASKLILDWSPEQISGWLKIRYPRNESMRVSHETIYRSLFIQVRGVLKKELGQPLRSKRLIRMAAQRRGVRKLGEALRCSLIWARALERPKNNFLELAPKVPLSCGHRTARCQWASDAGTGGPPRKNCPNIPAVDANSKAG